MENIPKKLDEIQDKIFSYDITDVLDKTIELIGILSVNEIEKNYDVDEIINTINIALNNQDYMLLADILEYRLKPIVG